MATSPLPQDLNEHGWSVGDFVRSHPNHAEPDPEFATPSRELLCPTPNFC